MSNENHPDNSGNAIVSGADDETVFLLDFLIDKCMKRLLDEITEEIKKFEKEKNPMSVHDKKVYLKHFNATIQCLSGKK